MHATLDALGTICQASPALCPCEPRRPRGEMQTVPRGARFDTRLLPASGSQPRSARIRSVRTYNTRIYIYFKVKTVITFCGHVQLSRKKRSSASSRRFGSCLDERWPARRESAGFPLSAPMPTYSRRDPGPKWPWGRNGPGGGAPAIPTLIGSYKKSTYNANNTITHQQVCVLKIIFLYSNTPPYSYYYTAVFTVCTYIVRPPSLARRCFCWLYTVIHSSSSTSYY